MDTTSYEEWLLGQGLEHSTINIYRGKLDQAHILTAGRGWDLESMTATQLSWLAEQFPQSRATLGCLRAALVHYWQMTGSSCPDKAIKLPKETGPGVYKGLEDDAAELLEWTARTHEYGLAVLVGLYLALRRGEMARMRWDDFTPELDIVRVLGKGRRVRLLPVHDLLQDHLSPNGVPWVFPGRTSHVHTGTIYNRIGRVAADAGLGHIHPHALRHTALTRLYEQTDDVRLVQEFAGHADPATTAKYTRVSQRRLRAAVDGFTYQQAA